MPWILSPVCEKVSQWALGDFMKVSDDWIVFPFSLGDTDNVFSVNADTGNLTMNKAATAPDSYLLQVMVSLMALQTPIQHSWLPRKQQSWNDVWLIILIIKANSVTPFLLEGPMLLCVITNRRRPACLSLFFSLGHTGQQHTEILHSHCGD